MPRQKTRREKGSGNISKVGSFYRLRIRTVAGKYISCKLLTPDGNGCTSYQDAVAAANLILDAEKEFNDLDSREKVVKELATIRNLRARLTIPLDEALEYAFSKANKAIPSKKRIAVLRYTWKAFAVFAKEKFRITNIADIEKVHAEHFFAILQMPAINDSGKQFKLSNNSINTYIKNCRYVFNRLLDDLGYHDDENPFRKISLLKKDSIQREVFSEAELKVIFSNPPPLMKGLFTIGLCTGLRLGDVATLAWKSIKSYGPKSFGKPDFHSAEIDIVIRKTVKRVIIPITPELSDYLNGQWEKNGSDDYVLPEAANMYLNNSSGLHYRIIRFLQSLGIETSVKVEGRLRRQSVKDFHSLRHSFCYYTGLRGIPLNIVQSIVGHASSEMTLQYQKHADREAKRNALMQMGSLIDFSTTTQNMHYETISDLIRNHIIGYVNNATEEDLLKLDKFIFSAQNVNVMEATIIESNHLLPSAPPEVTAYIPEAIPKPTKEALKILSNKFSRPKIGNIYGVSETCVRKWLKKHRLIRSKSYIMSKPISIFELDKIRHLLNTDDLKGLKDYQEPPRLPNYIENF